MGSHLTAHLGGTSCVAGPDDRWTGFTRANELRGRAAITRTNERPAKKNIHEDCWGFAM